MEIAGGMVFGSEGRCVVSRRVQEELAGKQGIAVSFGSFG
jgi:hypothetical protein